MIFHFFWLGFLDLLLNFLVSLQWNILETLRIVIHIILHFMMAIIFVLPHICAFISSLLAILQVYDSYLKFAFRGLLYMKASLNYHLKWAIFKSQHISFKFFFFLIFLLTLFLYEQILLVSRTSLMHLWMRKAVVSLTLFWDMLMGLVLFLPLAILAWFPFISVFQSRLLYNTTYSQGHSLQEKRPVTTSNIATTKIIGVIYILLHLWVVFCFCFFFCNSNLNLLYQLRLLQELPCYI